MQKKKWLLIKQKYLKRIQMYSVFPGTRLQKKTILYLDICTNSFKF